MKRSLKTHSASLKSSESCTLLFFYGHPSSKSLSVGPSADFYSCLDFCCAVLWLVDAVLCKISAFAAALESKWSKNPSNPFSLEHCCLFSPLISPGERSHVQYSDFGWLGVDMGCPAAVIAGQGHSAHSTLLYGEHIWGISLSPAGKSCF